MNQENDKQAFRELDTIANKLGVDDSVIEKASLIYRSALDRGLGDKGSPSAMIVASLYAACREMGTQRTLKDVAAVSKLSKKDLARCYRILFQELDFTMPVVDPSACVSSIAARAGLSERAQRRAYDILKLCNEARGTAGKEPMGLAAAALYIGSVMENENKNQKKVAEAAGVTEVTIRNRVKELKTLLNI